MRPLAPSDVGLPAGRRRRTPGLRREETAALAGMSADYHTRLEQARGPRPSRQTLTALARALRLTDDEHDHLFHLAGEEPPRVFSLAEHVPPGLQLVLDRLHDAPAQVLTDWGEVVTQNAVSKALTGDFASRPPQRRNLVRAFFLEPGARHVFPPEDVPARARARVAALRAVTAAHPGDPRPAALAAELRARSAEFARLWDDHRVAVPRAAVKRFRHPVVGLLELDCEVLLTPDRRRSLVVHTARPGSASQDRLRLLQVVGLQDMTTGGPPVPRAAGAVSGSRPGCVPRGRWRGRARGRARS
ncbi:helix-turn-helix transcriptional regulator [Streptomyces fragilis]|uniref:Helix-turn-helix transcriptional regulator n=1 Tax=Streptomyces fragilis TaxID=67301 RepID=A0ABV2YQJ5_9ACTN|nr:helix-turn-helix transcriptional regulator [Streptomyces fragilis]